MTTLPGVAAAMDGAVRAGHSISIVAMVAGPDHVIHASAHGAAKVTSVHRIYSMTKLVGVIAAQQLVETGALSWDTPVGDILPAFDDLQVLEGMDGTIPRLRPPASRATLLQLATHQSGCVYKEWNAGRMAYVKTVGLAEEDSRSLEGLAALPLAFDPGTAWEYGVGIDWLGAVIEAASSERLPDLCTRAIFAPLGMDDTAFQLSSAQRARLVKAYRARGADFTETVLEPALPAPGGFYGMGGCLFGTAPDFLKLLQALLRGGGPILSADSVRGLLAPASGTNQVLPLPTQSRGVSARVDLFPDQRRTFALAGLRVEQDVPGRRRAGSIGWAGMMNTHFWIDPATGIAAVLMMQHLPFVDDNALAVYDAFEHAVYAAREPLSTPRPLSAT